MVKVVKWCYKSNMYIHKTSVGFIFFYSTNEPLQGLFGSESYLGPLSLSCLGVGLLFTYAQTKNPWGKCSQF